MINYTAAALLATGLILHTMRDAHALLAATGIICAMAFFLLMYLHYPVFFIGSPRYPWARRCFPMIRWAIFGIYVADFSTTVTGYLGGPEWSVSIHLYSIWAGIYLVVYSLAILTGPPKRRRRKRKLQRHGQRRWIGQLAPVPA